MAVANRSRYELDLDNREIDLDAAALVVKGMANFMNAAAAVGGATVSGFIKTQDNKGERGNNAIKVLFVSIILHNDSNFHCHVIMVWVGEEESYLFGGSLYRRRLIRD
jgi:hypothetical protein